MSQWSEYIGKVRERGGQVSAKDLMGLASLLDYSVCDSAGELTLPWPEEAVPPFAHWLNGNIHAPQSTLGEDGHPARGSFLPDIPYPRRMWAGSKVRLLQDYRVGQVYLHRETIESIAHKVGRSGDMIFVKLIHEYFIDTRLVLQEEQDIVYRAAANTALPTPQPRAEAEVLARHDFDWCSPIHPDPVLLFRYSAVTFNSHRIHYDREYATGVEQYPGLLVHGPLCATLLVDLYQRNNPGRLVSEIEFKSIGPLFDIFPFYLMGKQSASGADLWAVDCEGATAMKMTLSTR